MADRYGLYKSIYHRWNHLCSDADPAGQDKTNARAYHGTSSMQWGSSWSDWNLSAIAGFCRGWCERTIVWVWEPSLERGQRCCGSGRIHRIVHGRIQSQCSRHQRSINIRISGIIDIQSQNEEINLKKYFIISTGSISFFMF